MTIEKASEHLKVAEPGRSTNQMNGSLYAICFGGLLLLWGAFVLVPAVFALFTTESATAFVESREKYASGEDGEPYYDAVVSFSTRDRQPIRTTVRQRHGGLLAFEPKVGKSMPIRYRADSP